MRQDRESFASCYLCRRWDHRQHSLAIAVELAEPRGHLLKEGATIVYSRVGGGTPNFKGSVGSVPTPDASTDPALIRVICADGEQVILRMKVL